MKLSKAKWIHNRHCMKKIFWTAKLDNNASFTWKLVLRTRGIHRKIANGKNTSLWFDLWIWGKSLSNIIGWSYMALFNSQNNTVSSIVN